MLGTCFSCGGEFDIEELDWINDEKFCKECAEEGSYYCENCGTLCHEEVREMQSLDEGPVCENCYSEYYVLCGDCDEPTHINRSNYVESRNVSVCDSCSSYYSICDGCGEYHHHDDLRSNGDYIYCYDCFEETSSEFVNCYSYKPDPLFFNEDGVTENEIGSTRYYGVEIEIECNGSSHEAAAYLHNTIGDFCYYKEDGSIDDGFEIVSNPFTFEWLKKNIDTVMSPIWKLHREFGCTSYDNDTCGLHIHFNKSSMSRRQVRNLISFFEKNKKFIFVMSRRTEGLFESYCPHISFESEDARIECIRTMRRYVKYATISFEANSTIECRMFKGTISRDGFMANIQFLDCLLDFCNDGTFNPDWRMFYCYLASRKDEIPEFFRTFKRRITNNWDDMVERRSI